MDPWELSSDLHTRATAHIHKTNKNKRWCWRNMQRGEESKADASEKSESRNPPLSSLLPGSLWLHTAVWEQGREEVVVVVWSSSRNTSKGTDESRWLGLYIRVYTGPPARSREQGNLWWSGQWSGWNRESTRGRAWGKGTSVDSEDASDRSDDEGCSWTEDQTRRKLMHLERRDLVLQPEQLKKAWHSKHLKTSWAQLYASEVPAV